MDTEEKNNYREEHILIRPYTKEDTAEAISIWNSVVWDGMAFPQEEPLNEENGEEFFRSQSYTGLAYNAVSGEIVGLYILHPNNVGRCGHICNASYAVKENMRGRHIGELLVTDCIAKAGQLGFRILQFNAVVAVNAPALALYKKLGFTQLGVIPKGFRCKSGAYLDIIPHYREV